MLRKEVTQSSIMTDIAQAMDVANSASQLLMLWNEPNILVGLCVEFRRTLPDEVIAAMLARLRSMSLQEALLHLNMNVRIAGYDKLCEPAFPTPDPTETHFWLSRGFMNRTDLGIVAFARSGWRGARGRRLCYKVKIDLADVRLELSGDEVNTCVERVQLSTNALMHKKLDTDLLRDIAGIRMQGTFDHKWHSVCVHDEGMKHGFTVCLRYEACAT